MKMNSKQEALYKVKMAKMKKGKRGAKPNPYSKGLGEPVWKSKV